MNKIVCDLCGTSYPETAAQCPICGTAKTDAAKTTTGSDSGYAYVKGGRFSHANVRKRNAGKKELPRVVAPVKTPKETPAPKPRKEAAPEKPVKETPAPAPKKEQPAEPKRRQAPVRQKPDKEKGKVPNVLLALIALLLVLAIVAVFAYIVKDFIDSRNQPTEPAGSSTTQSTAPEDVQVPCTGVRLALSEKTFTSLEDKFYLSVSVTPSDTTDSVWYESGDENIATVDEKGIVYPVANGQVTIYVHCGEFTAECSITCEVGVDPTQPTEPDASTGPTEPPVELKLNREDFTLNGYGDSHILYNGEIDRSEIIWTSSDETVATVTNGKVVAVGNGNATITAEYMGQKVTCEVHCVNVVVSEYELRTRYGLGSDFTISVGDTIVLYMVDKETGLRIQAENLTFTLSKDGVITIDENGKITAIASGDVTVTVTYGEHTLKSKVHVRKPKN